MKYTLTAQNQGYYKVYVEGETKPRSKHVTEREAIEKSLSIDPSLDVYYIHDYKVVVTTSESSNITQREILMDIYNNTDGDNWNNNTGWGSSEISEDWFGITLNNEGKVTRLDLQNNNLSGELPSSIGQLSSLEYLNVKMNSLEGSIPESIGELSQLTHLLLNGRSMDMNTEDPHHTGKPVGGSWADERSNNFTFVPTSIGNLSNLQWLELLGTGREGEGVQSIPDSIGDLTNLKGLHLAFNRLIDLPDTIGNLTNLIHLSFSEQGVKGSRTLKGQAFPQWISKLTNLKFLWAARNEMTGTIPDLSRLTNLEILLLNSNQLEGGIPNYLTNGTLPNINMIQLAWNNLGGTIPEINRPNDITAFTIEGNGVTGEIPDSWGGDASSKLINFGLGWNEIGGEFPDMSHCYQLRYIRANNNNLTGTVPMVDTSNQKLQFLDFKNNQMSGTVPVKLADVLNNDKFREITLSNNQFSDSDLESFLSAAESNGNRNKIVL